MPDWAGPINTKRLLALSELSFHHAGRNWDPSYYRAAAVYAYAFLFPLQGSRLATPYDSRLRLAMDLYNRGLIEGLRTGKDGPIDLSPRQLSLPFGSLSITSDASTFLYGDRHVQEFISLADYEIKGLVNEHRTSGIGMALSAKIAPSPGKTAWQMMPPNAKLPVSAFMRIDKPLSALRGGQVNGRIELFDADATPAVVVGKNTLPLESKSEHGLSLRTSINHRSGISKLLDFAGGDLSLFTDTKTTSLENQGTLFALGPYQPGRIPVVLVHGTVSSPARWAPMLNELISDPRLASHYQCWYFIYNSGNPVALSSLQLREKLQTAVKAVDPEGKDPAIRQMVIIGHSQGGLLAKMMVVSSGERFWSNISKSKFEMVTLSRQTKELLRRSLFIEPLPFVKRVIFISTPHRGSFLAENWVGKFANKFINFPAALTHVSRELVTLHPSTAKETALRIPTSLDNMDWSNPFLRTLASLPIAPGVHVNSIIAVKDSKPLDEKSNDGVVRYSSAHIKGVESEFVVRNCDHSAQQNPRAIEEVRRILYEHAGYLRASHSGRAADNAGWTRC